MKISTGLKIVLYIFTMLVLIQGLDVSYYLMNQQDSYLANLGLITYVATMAGIGYCFGMTIGNGVLYIKEQIKKQQ